MSSSATDRKVETEHISAYSSDQDSLSVDDIFNEKPKLTLPVIKNYFATRLTTLFDLPVYHSDKAWYVLINPIPALREMSWRDWNYYGLGWCGWVLDAMDFFCVSVALPEIAVSLKSSVADITWGVTLVLMLRAIGAISFGLASDRFGRKKCYIVICILFIIVEIATGFVQNLEQFLGVRAIFGILMGSMLPVCMITAMESQPVRARGILSGLFSPAYCVGYIMALVWYKVFAPTYKEGEGWRSLFWFSGGLSIILIIWRMLVPESEEFLIMQEKKKKFKEQNKKNGLHKYFNTTIIQTLKTEWLLFIYLCIAYAGWNFTSHGTQDLYVTMLSNQFGVDLNKRTLIVALSNVGGLIGGACIGNVSEVLGRRLSAIIATIFCGAFVYPSFYDADKNWGAYVVLIGFMIASWGISSAYALELVNKAHRTLLIGLAYQIGNLISAGSATIQAQLGEKYPIPGAAPGVYDYGKVMCIFCGAIFAFMVVILVLGPEKFHRNLKMTPAGLGAKEELEEGLILDSSDKEGKK
ncbi:JEN1 [Candida margitis]|uniref:JEN1 n=1 Tax=Candida margitis TaxID=1775924 RepID=UPI002227C307|nr:JEN1 [Candida margitis]KAI5959674.1 JEN1 [Candida margitis]